MRFLADNRSPVPPDGFPQLRPYICHLHTPYKRKQAKGCFEMSMAKAVRRTAAVAGGYLVATSIVAADAQTPTISGNGWVALAIIIGVVAIIYFVILGALNIEDRDARQGKNRNGHDRWYGVFGSGSGDDDDDDHHHFHHIG